MSNALDYLHDGGSTTIYSRSLPPMLLLPLLRA
jgi:hypothetical protein